MKPPLDRRDTKPIPRPNLAPISLRNLETGSPTLESCPACARCKTCQGRHLIECPTCSKSYTKCDGACASCTWCEGANMVTAERAAQWRQTEPPPPEVA